MDPVVAAANMDTDEIICVDELRQRLVALAEMAYQSTGRRRVKNPRIWSIHDLEILTRGRTAPQETVAQSADVSDVGASAPEEGAVAVLATMDGSFWGRPGPDDPAFLAPGEKVKPGDTIGLMEIMKTFSPIRAEISGTWLLTALEDGEPIQPGKVVGWVRPD
jgi:biotin carboxyl carrier protein